jgi:NAD(P)-dependent dehydrogenase (short-subunit alcohol dehydrogenase family)
MASGPPRVCVVAGVGPGNGAAFARRFAAEGWRVAMLARSADRLRELEKEIEGAEGFAVDLRDEAAVRETFARIRSELGPVDVLIHNAVAAARGEFSEVEPAAFENALRTNTVSLLICSQCVAPDMIARGAGAIVATGNTSARRGRARFAGFAPSKAAQRVLTESIARSLGPKGVHVAYVLIDAVIDLPWTRAMLPDRPDDFFARPDAIADTVWHLVHQDRSAWTFELDLRPYAEKW